MSAELISEYGKNPSNWGRLSNPDLTYREKNISCGEEISVDFCFDPEGRIMQIGFEAEGRLITIAAMSLLSETVENEFLEKVEKLTPQDVFDLLELTEVLTPRRKKSALLGLLTLKNAFRSYHGMPPLDFGDLEDSFFSPSK